MDAETDLTAADILGPSGSIARRLSNYEDRPQQLEMAEAVAAAIAARRHLIVEAGTGVGKSFAYLVPAILAATEPAPADAVGDAAKPPRRVVVSTHTIALQEQLLRKDLPLLNSVIPREFSAVLAKGRRNYISLRRLDAAMNRAGSLFGEEAEIDELRQLRKWASETHDGSQADMQRKPMPTVWDEVASDSGNCLGRRCPTYNKCFYYAARRRMQNAQVLVVNHALLFSDIALRRHGVSLLPDYEVVILDEAHTIEQIAGDHLGLRLSNGQVEYQLNKLFNDRTHKGLLVGKQFTEAIRQVEIAPGTLRRVLHRHLGVGRAERARERPRYAEGDRRAAARRRAADPRPQGEGRRQERHQRCRAAGLHGRPRPAGRPGRRYRGVAHAERRGERLLGRVAPVAPRPADIARRRAGGRRPGTPRASCSRRSPPSS